MKFKFLLLNIALSGIVSKLINFHHQFYEYKYSRGTEKQAVAYDYDLRLAKGTASAEVVKILFEKNIILLVKHNLSNSILLNFIRM